MHAGSGGESGRTERAGGEQMELQISMRHYRHQRRKTRQTRHILSPAGSNEHIVCRGTGRNAAASLALPPTRG